MVSGSIESSLDSRPDGTRGGSKERNGGNKMSHVQNKSLGVID